MNPISFSIKGHTPYPSSGGDNEEKWCRFVAEKATHCAMVELATIPVGATFAVTLDFFHREYLGRDLDNLAKTVIDTLFYGREVGWEKKQRKFPFGVLFPDRPLERKDLSDFYVCEIHISKHKVEDIAKEGVDIIVRVIEKATA